MPTNTDGGGLSACHPGMRGMFLIVEAVRQLRGEGGATQVPDAEIAVAHGTGARSRRAPPSSWRRRHRDRRPHRDTHRPAARRETSQTEARAATADHDSASYWEGLHEGKLLVQRCQDCAKVQLYPRRPVPGVPRSGGLGGGERTGHRLLVHCHSSELLTAFSPTWIPYVVALVDLEEGPRLMTDLVDCEPDDVQVGMAVEGRIRSCLGYRRDRALCARTLIHVGPLGELGVTLGLLWPSAWAVGRRRRVLSRHRNSRPPPWSAPGAGTLC